VWAWYPRASHLDITGLAACSLSFCTSGPCSDLDSPHCHSRTKPSKLSLPSYIFNSAPTLPTPAKIQAGPAWAMPRAKAPSHLWLFFSAPASKTWPQWMQTLVLPMANRLPMEGGGLKMLITGGEKWCCLQKWLSKSSPAENPISWRASASGYCWGCFHLHQQSWLLASQPPPSWTLDINDQLWLIPLFQGALSAPRQGRASRPAFQRGLISAPPSPFNPTAKTSSYFFDSTTLSNVVGLCESAASFISWKISARCEAAHYQARRNILVFDLAVLFPGDRAVSLPIVDREIPVQPVPVVLFSRAFSLKAAGMQM